MILRLIKIRRSLLVTMFAALSVLTSAVFAEQPVVGLQPQGLDYAGIYGLRQLDPNLTGAGVKCAVICRSITYIDGEPQNDYRPDENHNCFENTRFDFYDQQYLPAGVSAHSTAVCSILFGRDPNAYNDGIGDFLYEGVAPEAQPEIYEFWHFLINNIFPFSAPDVNIITADIGYQFEDWWTRGFEAMAQHYGLTVVIGIGNGSNSSDPPLYPGAGSNVIGVGVVKSADTNDTATGLTRFALVYPEYSSEGPTSDGRSKPDIVAPGNCLAAVAGEPNLYEPTGTWSSFATPIVAGTAALLVQQASMEPNLQPATSSEGGNCVIKAVLLNSATKLPYWHKGLLTKDDDHDVPLDWLQGAGMVNALAAHNQLSAGRRLPGNCPPAGWDLNKLNLDETPANTYKIRIPEPADKMISATAVWNKNFAGDYPFEHERELDADIRLEVWAVDSNEPNNYYLLDFSDSRVDNVEHIYCPADANFTEYEIIVLYSDDHDVNQPAATPPYALVWNVAQAPARDDSLWLDLNADGVVDDLDLVALLDNVLASVETPQRYLFGDINSDGVLDLNDIQIFFKYLDNTAEQNVEELKAEDASPVLQR
ncbi:MAG: S8 family serine peptidase [Planctomycetota bacterium]